ncbi:hypothetical protein K523DRAFT_349463 [Schizophyllum commune Tattone D]|nr:hypothetical protein K523DRAFT_349463 [Schizophyllum commune Tattone D]
MTVFMDDNFDLADAETKVKSPLTIARPACCSTGEEAQSCSLTVLRHNILGEVEIPAIPMMLADMLPGPDDVPTRNQLIKQF